MTRGRRTGRFFAAALVVMTLALICVACGGGDKKPRLATLSCDVQGMTCTGCEQSIVGSVRKIEGVAEARADFRRGAAVVRYDPRRVKPAAIQRAIEKAGYTVTKTKVD